MVNEIYRLTTSENIEHYQLIGFRSCLLTRDIESILIIFKELNVNFTESENVYNIFNGAVLPKQVEKEILLHDIEGEKCVKRLNELNQKN